jgi:hypothetical protein
MRPLLRSRLHRLASGRLLLVTFHGRRSGKEYTLTLGYFPWEEDTLLSISSRPWVKNLRDEAPARVLVRGRWRDVVAMTAEDIESVSALLARFAQVKGPRMARGLLLGLPRDRQPTAEELRRAAALTSIIVFRPTN